jgi:hypothetical protein
MTTLPPPCSPAVERDRAALDELPLRQVWASCLTREQRERIQGAWLKALVTSDFADEVEFVAALDAHTINADAGLGAWARRHWTKHRDAAVEELLLTGEVAAPSAP